jgi:hypothetical protein
MYYNMHLYALKKKKKKNDQIVHKMKRVHRI